MAERESVSRRSLLKASLALAGAGLLQLGASTEAAVATPTAATSGDAPSLLAFRHIHLDFHTSPAITGVGKDFNAAQFAGTLRDAKVNSITIFAKCHHGMAYYPTKVGVQHPHLNFDLFGQMLEALHRERILAPVYISTLYDQHAWREHGDWRAIDPDGREEGLHGTTSPITPQLGRLCVNTPYLDYLAAMAEEVLTSYDADGVFYDNFGYDSTGCSCSYCIAEREKLGLDSRKQEDRMKHMYLVMERAMQRLTGIARARRPRGTYFFNGVLKLRQDPAFLDTSLKYESHVEIESLPGGSWGYSYFPMAVRQLRNLGRETRGMTGAFHRSWGDFGTVRNQAALDYECFAMLAQAAKCCVGDHLHPSGRLNSVTYDRIGQTYRSVAAKEPWSQGAKALTEIGSLLSYDGSDGASSDVGATAMLTQLRQQFDLIDSSADFSRYKVLVLPDSHRLDEVLRRKLSSYLASGGKLLLSNESGLDLDGKQFVLPVGAEYESPWKHDNQYLEVVDAKGKGFPPMVEIAYETGAAVTAAADGTVLARCWRAYFDKDYEHFQVEQTPPSEPTGYAGVVATASTVYFATPIFRTYARYAYAFDRDLFGYCLRRLLPEPFIKVTGPSTMQATLTEQPDRRMVHLLNYAPERRAPEVDVVEDVCSVSNVKVELRMDRKPGKVYLAPEQIELPFSYADGYAQTVVPILTGHQIIVFENS